MGGLAVQDMAGELDHVFGDLRALDVLEIVFLVAQFVGVAQRGAEQALAERLDRHDVLAVGEHDPRQRDAVLVLHGIADHGKGLDGRLAVGRDVIGMVEIALVDLVPRHEAVDVDGVVALDLDGVEFLRLDLDIFAFAELIAAGLLVALDHVAGLGVDHLLLQPVAGLLVDHVEAGLFGRRRRRIDRDRAGHERKFQGAFPIGAGGHYNLRTVEG